MKSNISNVTILTVFSMCFAICGCSHTDTGTKTETPAQLKQQNDKAKASANESKLNAAISQTFSNVTKQSGSKTVEKATLQLTEDAAGQFQFSLELKFSDRDKSDELNGAVQTVTDSDQLTDLNLGDAASGTFLSSQSTTQKEQCIDLRFNQTAEASVTELLLCESGSAD